jgi:hypothetical protein
MIGSEKGPQLSFNDFLRTQGEKPPSVPPLKNIQQEEINHMIDERAEKEIPNLWFIKKSEMISGSNQKGFTTRKLTEEYAIVRRYPRKRHPNQFNYFLRFPLTVMELEDEDHKTWTMGQGSWIDTFSRQRKIPKALMSEVKDKLYQSYLQPKLRPQSPEVSRQTKS